MKEMEPWKGYKWAWYRYGKRKTAHWYHFLGVLRSPYAFARCGEITKIDMLEPEMTAKTLCKKCLKIKGTNP